MVKGEKQLVAKCTSPGYKGDSPLIVNTSPSIFPIQHTTSNISYKIFKTNAEIPANMSFFLRNPHLRALYQDIPPFLNGLDPFTPTDAKLRRLKKSHMNTLLEQDVRTWAQRRADVIWEKIIQEKGVNFDVTGAEARRIKFERRIETRWLKIAPLGELESVLGWPHCFDDDDDARTLDTDQVIENSNASCQYVATSTEEEARYQAIHLEMQRLHNEREIRRDIDRIRQSTSLSPSSVINEYHRLLDDFLECVSYLDTIVFR